MYMLRPEICYTIRRRAVAGSSRKTKWQFGCVRAIEEGPAVEEGRQVEKAKGVCMGCNGLGWCRGLGSMGLGWCRGLRCRGLGWCRGLGCVGVGLGWCRGLGCRGLGRMIANIDIYTRQK